MEVTQLSTVPVIASHSGVKAIVDTARNLTDEEMIAIKDTGGVVGIVAFSSYPKKTDPERRPALTKIGEIYGSTSLADVMANAPDQVEQFKADMAAHEQRFPRANVGPSGRLHRLRSQAHRHRPRDHQFGHGAWRRSHRLDECRRGLRGNGRTGNTGLFRGRTHPTMVGQFRPCVARRAGRCRRLNREPAS